MDSWECKRRNCPHYRPHKRGAANCAASVGKIKFKARCPLDAEALSTGGGNS